MTTKLNLVYHAMLARCYNPKAKSYKDYGGRGIGVCDEWKNQEKICTHYGIWSKGWKAFEKWALENGYAEGLTIDRIDNGKGYCPENCRWVTKKVQSNNRRYCRLITYNGKTQNLKQWCNELGLDYKKTHNRIVREKWSVKKAFECKENPYINYITYNGKTQSVAEWARELNISYGTLRARLYKYNMPIERAFTKK
jgi:hypothetical protein